MPILLATGCSSLTSRCSSRPLDDSYRPAPPSSIWAAARGEPPSRSPNKATADWPSISPRGCCKSCSGRRPPNSCQFAACRANLVELDGVRDKSLDGAICLFSTLGMIRGRKNRRRVLDHAQRILRPGRPANPPCTQLLVQSVRPGWTVVDCEGLPARAVRQPNGAGRQVLFVSRSPQHVPARFHAGRDLPRDTPRWVPYSAGCCRSTRGATVRYAFLLSSGASEPTAGSSWLKSNNSKTAGAVEPRSGPLCARARCAHLFPLTCIELACPHRG